MCKYPKIGIEIYIIFEVYGNLNLVDTRLLIIPIQVQCAGVTNGCLKKNTTMFVEITESMFFIAYGYKSHGIPQIYQINRENIYFTLYCKFDTVTVHQRAKKCKYGVILSKVAIITLLKWYMGRLNRHIYPKLTK